MAQVVLENIYKSFAGQRGTATTPVATPAPLAGLGAYPSSSDASGRLTTVLRAINLTVEDGEFMVLVGPSGCGKSTMLRLIAGLESLTGGTIWVGDRRVNDLPPKQRDIAMVFQNYALYPHMTVYDNLAFGLRRSARRPQHSQSSSGGLEHLLVSLTRKMPKPLRYQSASERAIAQQIQTVAEMLQIEALLERFPRQLSGGQKQRVALGRAIARNPQVFLMDEPLSNLDAKLRTETRAQIIKLQRQLGTTTLYVTHDQTEAMTMGDRIAVMNAGQIQQIASPLELYNHPVNRFVAEFIGSPPMNFLPMLVTESLKLHHPQFHLPLPPIWEAPLQPYRGQTLTLGIRPEHLSLAAAAPEHLPVEVELVEALGNDTYLAVSLQETGESLQVRVAPECPIRPGESLWLALTPTKVHLFDPQTGQAIASA
ncbi:sugar ABC transporter ATP-binding protein [Neosynechococcus sphagnicola sy1]|uniref:Sugar ABC transporter ATP-binding protein n=1 Tax=Neosynechococcus sphagnicola sy1 TaxID=1497020 RepID=A0A098TH78_9CYAN|nr:ATP-binding cassette domain-containing protein [Neosynechococcus sphagnicola]KGF71940.1 sugar ABC transporter ATP-binding protein [Neosynechococcus sphagnicola sy1]